MLQSEALNILKTGASVFLTGEPGSGKTYVTNAYVRYLRQAKVDVAVTASTGIAATHLGGMTIHSWSGIGISKSLSDWDVDRIASEERIAKRIGRTTVLIIDEISMLDGRTLDSVERVCREVKRRPEPFGGIQVVLVGDFFQLPPVARDGEPPAQFAFSSNAWTAASPLVCYLSEQHRQADDDFCSLLSSLRRNEVTNRHHAILDARCNTAVHPLSKDMPKLYPHNVDVDRINDAELAKIPGQAQHYEMSFSGRASLAEQLKKGCLSPEHLYLKRGAAVMFTKNSAGGNYVNGTLGTVIDFDDDSGYPIVQTRTGQAIVGSPAEWSVEERGRLLATISQIPLRLAWAMTIHKSQGMSLDAAYIDLKNAFVEGQGYVALSRVRTLNGLFLSGWNRMALQVHPEVLAVDYQLRQRSDESRAAFGRIGDSELRHLHQNFITACGGILEKEKTPTISSPKKYSVDSIREKHPNAYKSWSEEDDERLTEQYTAGNDIGELMVAFGRKRGAIRSRLAKLGLLEI